ncbi:MAG: PIN domain-containing protein [Sporichthyaceae bacterium]
MARSARRRDTPSPSESALVLDSQGLSRAAAGDPYAVAWVARAREQCRPLVINAVTLTETLRGTARDAQIHRIAKNAQVDVVDRSFAAEAGALLGRTNRSEGANALVATSAIRLAQPVHILTSDPGDLEALTVEHPQIQVVGI